MTSKQLIIHLQFHHLLDSELIFIQLLNIATLKNTYRGLFLVLFTQEIKLNYFLDYFSIGQVSILNGSKLLVVVRVQLPTRQVKIRGCGCKVIVIVTRLLDSNSNESFFYKKYQCLPKSKKDLSSLNLVHCTALNTHSQRQLGKLKFWSLLWKKSNDTEKIIFQFSVSLAFMDKRNAHFSSSLFIQDRL